MSQPKSKTRKALGIVGKIIAILWIAGMASLGIFMFLQIYSCSTDIGRPDAYPHVLWEGSNDTISHSVIYKGGEPYYIGSVFSDVLEASGSEIHNEERPVFYNNGLFYKFIGGRFLWADLYGNGGIVSKQEYDADLVAWVPPYAYLAEKNRSRLAVYNVEQDRIVWREGFRPGTSVMMTGGRCVWIFDHTLYVLDRTDGDWYARKVADVSAVKPEELAGDVLKMSFYSGGVTYEYISISTGEPRTESDFAAEQEAQRLLSVRSDDTYYFDLTQRKITMVRRSDNAIRTRKFSKLARSCSKLRYALHRNPNIEVVGAAGEIFFIVQYNKMLDDPQKAVFYYDYDADSVTYIADDEVPLTVIDPITGAYGRIL